MVEAHTITFYGQQADAHGMPVPFHHYLVIATEAPYLGNGAVASITALTESAMPAQAVFPVKNATPGHAAEQAIHALESLPQNQALLKCESL